MAKPKTTILIAEDDEAIASGLALNLSLEGFSPAVVGDGEAALAAIESLRPDLILLDISLPKMTGLEVLEALGAEGSTTPVIVLSAHRDEYDKVAALRLGADDYVTKPFGVAELLARIDAVLRRLTPRVEPSADEGAAAQGPSFGFADVAIDPDTREVTMAGEAVPLTRLEFDLLRYFVENSARVFDRRQLLSAVWGIEHSGSPRTVDNFVARLRAKFEPDPNESRHFVTVRGSGYRFDP